MNQTSKQNPLFSKAIVSRSIYILGVLMVLLAASLLRTYQLDWDAGTHVHPDERYLTMVTSALKLPFESVDEGGAPLCNGLFECADLYLDTANSPSNPANLSNFANYSYGTLPLLLTRYTALLFEGACQASPGVIEPTLERLFRDQRMSDACQPGLWTGYNGVHLVGRMLSALIDVTTVLAVMLIGRLLRNEKVSILAGMFYALAVLPIQHSHFYVVDNCATAFAAWTLFFTIRALKHDKLFCLGIAGITTGLGVACKISVWPLALIVALTALLYAIKHGSFNQGQSNEKKKQRDTKLIFLATAVILSGLLAALSFRLGQPYAFDGPGLFGVGINEHWLVTMQDSLELASGLRDVPFGHQWTARTPILFPMSNMIFWGMGLALGLTAWVGWAWVGWGIYRKRRWIDLILWVWGTGFFVYQATQWVKSMRYILPIYPAFAVFAAIVLIDVVEAKWDKTRIHSNLRKALEISSSVVALLVIVATIAWAYAFLHIYNEPLTRISASQWMYENVPTAVTAMTTSGEDIHIPLKSVTLGSQQQILPFSFGEASTEPIATIRINKVLATNSPGERMLTLVVGQQAVTQRIDLDMGVARSVDFDFDPPIVVDTSMIATASLELVDGDPVLIDTTAIANEHWDDPLPLRLDGNDPFWNWYRSLYSSDERGQMNNYDNDTLEKRASLLAWLDEADYIALSSNRLYASIPRLPMRYPMTTEYYRALFSGELGFELAAEFVSFPTIGELQFPDQEVPFDVIEPVYTNAASVSVSYPPAEEAFSVYDHPTVMLFRKTAKYSRENAERLLPESLLDDVQWMTPLEATRGSSQDKADKLIMSTRMTNEQQSGGTWSKIFTASNLRNRSSYVAALVWWLMLLLLGWVAFPIVYKAFPNFMLRGYALARLLGLLLWAYVGWVLASIRILPSVAWSQWLILAVMALFACYWYWRKRDEVIPWLKTYWSDLLRVETVFTVLFLAWVIVRSQNPDLWHPVAGGEKPMDFAFFNAIIKSTWFPPYDPWFSGGTMNYYYFGFVLFSTLSEALGIMPSIAYNLAIPSLFAFTGVGAYTLAANLIKGDRHLRRRAGLWGVLIVLVLGNYGEMQLLVKGFSEIGGIDFESLIPGYPKLISTLVGLYKHLFQGVALPFRPEWWYWNATRVIPYVPGEVGAINEFPAFSYLYGDLHAHAMALPLTQLALAVAVSWVKCSWSRLVHVNAPSVLQRVGRIAQFVLPSSWHSLLVGALVVGALRATNTWDYPTYLALMGLALIFPLLFPDERNFPDKKERQLRLWRLLGPVLLLIVAEVAYLPFSQNYVSAYLSVEKWTGSRTPLGAYMIMHGQFIIPLAISAAVALVQIVRSFIKQSGERSGTDRESEDHAIDIPILLLLLLAVAVAVIMLVLLWYYKAQIVWVTVPLGIAAAIILLGRDTSRIDRFRWLMVGTAMALSIFVEIFVLKGDIGRMNTVFKFYLQVWMLLGVNTAVTVSQIFSGALFPSLSRGALSLENKPRERLQWLESATVVLCIVSLAVSSLYPLLAIPGRIKDRWVAEAPTGLDGMQFMKQAVQYEHGSRIELDADYRVIQWIQQNIQGSPVIMEQQAEREYLWGGRISVYTGLPAVASWRWHSVQQRLVMPAGTVEARQNDVRLFYMTTNSDLAKTILDRYDVSYVVLGPYDKAYTLPEGLAKFDIMVQQGMLSTVYDDGVSKVYRVLRN